MKDVVYLDFNGENIPLKFNFRVIRYLKQAQGINFADPEQLSDPINMAYVLQACMSFDDIKRNKPRLRFDIDDVGDFLMQNPEEVSTKLEALMSDYNDGDNAGEAPGKS